MKKVPWKFGKSRKKHYLCIGNTEVTKTLLLEKDTDIMKIKKVNASELHEMLCKGTVKFQFTKKDGTVRTAVGTLKNDLITRKPAGGENKVEGAGYTTYFDIEKDAFRCFAESKLIGVVEE